MLHVNARLDTQVRIVRSPARADTEEVIPLAAQQTYQIKLQMDVTLSVNAITYPRDRIILILDYVHTKRSHKSTLVIVAIIPCDSNGICGDPVIFDDFTI